jgi:hypothetical protein
MLIALVCAVVATAETPEQPSLDLDPRKRLSADDLARKNEGWYLTGLPLAAYDPNFGFGGGARVYFYENGERDNPLFPYTPYLHRVFLQGFASTGGLQFHWLDWDAPYLAGTQFRVRGQLIYERQLARNYFGVGPRSLRALTSPADGKSYETMADYQASLEGTDAGPTYSRYDVVDLARPAAFLWVQRTFLSGTLRPLLGFTFSHTTLRDYTGEDVDGHIMARTRLREDCDAGRARGCDGGWDNMFRIGLAYDTRDFEPDPNSGVFLDAALDAAHGALGSDYDYLRALGSGRIYWSPFPELADFVLAGRGTLMWQGEDTPFFSMNLFPYTEDSRAGLGGLRTLRGFSQDRFIGPVTAFVNAEARWTFGHTDVLGQSFGFILAAFVDSGRVWNEIEKMDLRRWQTGGGGALRIAWNQATIIMIDYGVSGEGTGLYINFNHIF